MSLRCSMERSVGKRFCVLRTNGMERGRISCNERGASVFQCPRPEMTKWPPLWRRQGARGHRGRIAGTSSYLSGKKMSGRGLEDPRFKKMKAPPTGRQMLVGCNVSTTERSSSGNLTWTVRPAVSTQLRKGHHVTPMGMLRSDLVFITEDHSALTDAGPAHKTPG